MRLKSVTPPVELSWKVSRDLAIQRLQNLRRQHSGIPLYACETWNDVRCWIEGVGHREPETDAVLRSVLEAAKAAPDELWHEITLFLFWRPLVMCRRGLKRYDEEKATIADLPDVRLDSEILWAFITVLHRIDLDARRDRLGLKILNDVQHDVRHHYADELKRTAKHIHMLIDEEEEDELERGVHAPGIEDDEFAAVERRQDVAWVRAYLKALVRRGMVSGPDYLILIGCLIYGHSTQEMAARLGMSYDAARKRRQRVLKYFQENARKLSHSIDETPLREVEGRKPRRRNHG